MRYTDHSTNLDRFDNDVRPLIRGMLQNRRIMGDGHEDAPLVTEAIKYTSQPQYRRKTTTYDGSNQDIQRILDTLPFDEPLDFQIRSWETVTELLRKQSITGQSYATLFSAPTGIGKTECFLGPVLQQLLDGVMDHALIVYPRQSLLQDQFQRILRHLHDIRENSKFGNLSVGVWYGPTPRNKDDVQSSPKLSNEKEILKLTECWCEADDGTHPPFFLNAGTDWYNIRCPSGHQYQGEDDVVLHKQGVRYNTPDIVLTTLESLELFALKPNYDLIRKFDTIVFDELHLFNGTYGAHAANVIQNIRSIVPNSHLFMGSSATLENPNLFCQKMFGLDEDLVSVIEPNPDVDYVETDDEEHYYFVLSDDQVSLASTYIEQLLLLSHSFLEEENGVRKKILSFIDSVSQVNQKETQFYDADVRRQLWQYHENWPNVATQTAHNYIDKPISTTKAFSDSVVRSNQLSTTDLIFSTSFLEVGIDIPDIHVITQYRAPWSLSSFVQRSGRAARTKGTDSHIVTFLSQQTGDHNLFYRADRFLDSEIATPLNTNNRIVNWIHNQYLGYYEVADRVLNKHSEASEDRRTRSFLQGFLIDEMEFGAFHNFLLDPKNVLSEYSDEYPTGDLLDTVNIEKANEGLVSRKEEISETISPVAEFLSTDTDELLLQDNALKQFLTELRQNALSVLSRFEEHLSDLESDTNADSVRETEQTIETVKTKLNETATDVDAEIESFVEVTGTLQQLQGQLTTLGGIGTGNIGVGRRKLTDLQTAVESLVTLVQQGDFEKQQRERKEIYYLRNCLNEFRTFVTTPWGFASLYAVKHLLRAAYYFDQNRNVSRETDRTIYYVPENYFDSGGLSFTLIAGADQSEQSVDNLTAKYAPYRYEYQESGEEMIVFQPDITRTDDGLVFDYSSTISGDIRDGVLIPSSVTAKRVKDVSGSEGMSIVAYRTSDYELLASREEGGSTEQDIGKFHSTPRLSSSVQDPSPVREHGTLTLANVTGKVTIERVDIDITPARFVGDGYIFSGEGKTISVDSPDPPLGYVVDTRAVMWDLDSLVDTLRNDDALVEKLKRYKTLEAVDIDEVILYTAAHYLLLLVADVSGSSPGHLLYSIDQDQQRVAVFERSEGGQGVVDLLLETKDTAPAKVTSSQERVGYNPQIETERLWTDEEFVRTISDVDIGDREAINEIVTEQLSIGIKSESRIVEEVISTLDRIADIADQQDLTYKRVCNLKHDIASLTIDGVSTVRGHIAGAYGEELDNIDHALELLASPDIDGCVENLHVPYPMTAEDQEEVVSYVVLERLRDEVI